MSATFSPEVKLQLLRSMLRIRLFEEKIVASYPAQDMKTPVHLYIGQEAVAAGVCRNLAREDMMFSTHRNHGHCLAKGADMRAMVAELYGKREGCARGKGGSMHMVDRAAGCPGTSSIVGGGIPLAVGAALAARMRKAAWVAVAFFGDGGADQGTFQESVSFASLKKLPVLFVCENNFYATNSHQRARQPDEDIAKRVEAYGVRSSRIDGNDVLAVCAGAREALDGVRAGEGPRFLEFLTYRWKGHVGPETDHERGCRPRDELEAWMRRCPIRSFAEKLSAEGCLTDALLQRMREDLAAEIEAAWKHGRQDCRLPGAGELYENVYSRDRAPCPGPRS